MTIFPTTSTHVLETTSWHYDLQQLKSVVKAAQSGKVKQVSDPLDCAEDGTQLFHLHTLTLDVTLKPPVAELQYWGRGPQANPEYTAFEAIRNDICSHIDPLVPLPLMPFTRNALRGTAPNAGLHLNHYNRVSPSINVFLPTSRPKQRLFGIGDLPNHLSKEWMPNSNARDMQHWLNAVLALDPDGVTTRKANYRDEKRRFFLDSDLSILWVPGDGDEVELKFLMTINCRVDMVSLYDPLPEIGHDLLGLILHSLIPSSTATNPVSESEARAAALRHFFACLQPAPDHPITFNVNLLQPKEMVSKLLPFQARTLALLLKREGSPIAGYLKPKTTSGFWESWDLGGSVGRVAYRRCTGEMIPLKPILPPVVDRKGKGKMVQEEELVDGLRESERRNLPILLDLSEVKGTMLCEEMGLGKTVEAIALTLLHRHPLSSERAMTLPNKGQSVPSSSRTKEPVPTIDLLSGPPNLDEEEVGSWIEEQKKAFHGKKAWDETAQVDVTEVGTTLIVAPPVLLKQWVSEIRNHCPYLRVCVYEGWKSLQKGIEKQHDASLRVYRAQLEEKKRKASTFNKTVRKYRKLNRPLVKLESEEAENEEEEPEVEVKEESSLEICQRQFVDYVRAHDIVITTYQDLSSDLKVALPAPPRARRSNANYRLGERPRSPLIMVEWWRVIMDEVQLHSDQSDAAEMVSLIPRRNSLAVSGTPAKSDIKDLMGSLKFLRVPLLPSQGRLWHRLQQSSMRTAFEAIFREIAVRTTKEEVKGEFSLPSQSRFVIPIELSEIELHYYNDTLDRQRDILHLPAYGRDRPSDWVLDRSLFRACLMTLRQICTHIQVGQAQQAGRRERLNLGRALMTMSEALEKMRDDHAGDFLLESRYQLRKLIEKAQLMMLTGAENVQLNSVLAIYEAVRDKVTKQLGSVREHLQNLLQGLEDSDDEGEATRQMSQKEKEKAAALITARTSIRELLIIQHQTWFFEGDVRHMQNNEDREVECYTRADEIRKEILNRPLKFANNSVEKLGHALKRSTAIESVSELQTSDTTMQGGLMSDDIVTKANELLKILNGNAELVFQWRKKIIQLLSSPIDAETGALAPGTGTKVENPDEEYYAEALQAQGDVEAYLIAYAASVADRKEFLSEERSILTEHDGRIAKQRTTKRAELARIDAIEIDAPDEVREQAALLMAERQAFRDARDLRDCTRPLKALLFDLSPIMHGSERPQEAALAKLYGGKIRAYLSEQTEYVDKLNKELDLFRKTFNQRVKYFAALQEISDSVTAPEYKDLGQAIASRTSDINESEARLARMLIKGRYLQYLATKESGEEELREDCIICMGSSEDTEAVLLDCGHFFCNSCYREYRRTVQGRKCPSCRTDIDDRAITTIKLTGAEHPAEEKRMLQSLQFGEDAAPAETDEPLAEMSSEEAERQRREADLNRLRVLDVRRRREIASIDMLGEYGSKINFLIKHLHWYKINEPDARHVIFSNWSDSLNIVLQALHLNGISFVSFDQGGKKKDIVDRFVNDTSISVFLLHAEKESSGLTLTACRVVHLLEPVLKHSFELQAIGRVDRLGQDKETTVYCYATMETVESRILSQGVRNGTSIYLKDEGSDNVVASMPNVVSAAHKGGDLSNDGNEEELLSLIL